MYGKRLRTSRFGVLLLQTFLRGSGVRQAQIISLVELNPSGRSRPEVELNSTHAVLYFGFPPFKNK